MADAYQRHGISEAAWTLLEPLLPGRKGVWGGSHTITGDLMLDFENGGAVARFAALL